MITGGEGGGGLGGSERVLHKSHSTQKRESRYHVTVTTHVSAYHVTVTTHVSALLASAGIESYLFCSNKTSTVKFGMTMYVCV